MPVSRRAAIGIDIAIKLVMYGLLVVALFEPHLHQFHNKAFGARAIFYPLASLVVPGTWLALRRRSPFPVDVDILITLPFLFDMLGNAFNLYDTVNHWDDLNHLVNWAILTAGFGRALVRLPLGRLNVASLCVGFGATTAILWELAEYVTFIRNNARELHGAYHDTLGDLALGLTGSVIAGIFTAWCVGRGSGSSRPGRTT